MTRVRSSSLLALAPAGILAGCAAEPPDTGSPPMPAADSVAVETGEATASNPLAGTAWQLVEIQSMDDSQGTTEIEEPSRYVMRLNADGTAELRLDCNSATGPWSARPSADPDNGNFRLGPLAATTALCPPPRHDERITADARYIRGYLLRDGRLYLSLMADGGIYGWEPHTPAIPYSRVPDRRLEDAIRRVFPDYTSDVVAIHRGSEARYLYSRFDLDGDAAPEVLVYLLGPTFCGTGGCNLLLFTPVDGGYDLLANFRTTRTPVVVSTEGSGRWPDLWRLQSGGGRPASYVRTRYDGGRYVEAERVPAASIPDGTEVLAGEVSYGHGIPLAPGD